MSFLTSSISLRFAILSLISLLWLPDALGQLPSMLGGLPRPSLWVDAGANASGGTNGLVISGSNTTWQDISGNYLTLSRSTANAPTYVANIFQNGYLATPTTTHPGILFNNAARYFAVTNNTSLNTDVNGYSQKCITLFLKTGSDVSTRQVIWEQGDYQSPNDRGLNLYLENGRFYASLWDDACTGAFLSSGVGSVSASTNYLVTVLYDQNVDAFKLYVNGVQVDSYAPAANFDAAGLGGTCGTMHPNGFDSLAAHSGNVYFGANGGTRYNTGTGDGSGTGVIDYFRGYIAEMVQFNSGSEVMRVILENALVQKYNHSSSYTGDYFNNAGTNYTNELIGIGRFSATEIMGTNYSSSGGMYLASQGTFADDEQYIFAANNGTSGLSTLSPSGSLVGPSISASARSWRFSVSDPTFTMGNVDVCFDVDVLGLPLSNQQDYFLIANGTPLVASPNTKGTGNMKAYSSTSRRVCFSVNVYDLLSDGGSTVLDGTTLSVGVDNPQTVLENTATGNCGDGVDNDYDGYTDINDTGCKVARENINAGGCSNAVDDDGDGLIDCFDPDCNNGGSSDCATSYYGQPAKNCTYKPEKATAFNMTRYKSVETSYPIEQRTSVVVGDVDGDGRPEMLSIRPKMSTAGITDWTGVANDPTGRIQIFSSQYSGSTLPIKQSMKLPNGTSVWTQLAIADVDKDGAGDIFIVQEDLYLYRYEYCGTCGTHADGTKLQSAGGTMVWKSSQPVFFALSSPQVCDFNGDGKPEVYVNNMVFDAITGLRLVSGNRALSMGLNTSTGDAWPIAYDISSVTTGLELVCGNKVYAVNLGNGDEDNGSLTEIASCATTYGGVSQTGVRDGFTSVADMDNDNDLDIVVVASNRVIIWDPSDGHLLAPVYTMLARSGTTSTGPGSRANLGDFDGDGFMEMGIASLSIYHALNFDNTGTISELWRRDLSYTYNGTTYPSILDGSSMSGNTLFDFEGDGSTEVIYSDEPNVYVWRTQPCEADMVTGVYPCSDAGYYAKELFRTSSGSGTRTDYPLVVDVDADDQPEIVLTAQATSGPSDTKRGYISVYECTNVPFVKTRKVWNQNGFFNTNINDDLTIPANQQSHYTNAIASSGKKYMNGFLSQNTFLDNTGKPIYPAPDPNVTSFVPSVNSSTGCNQVTFNVSMNNPGDAIVPSGMYISVFENDPYNLASSPVLKATATLPTALDIGGTYTFPAIVVTEAANYFNTARSYTLLLNDNATATTATLPYGKGTTATERRADSIHTSINDCKITNNLQRVSISACVVLPVSFLSLAADNSESRVDIRWETSYEQNIGRFVIERAAKTGASLGQFEEIGEATPTNNMYQGSEYIFPDMEPLNGVSYYRLRSEDIDGKITYSNMVEVVRNLAAGSFIRVYPNPVSPNSALTIDGVMSLGVNKVSVHTPIGTEVLATEAAPNAQGAINLPLTNLPPAVYLLKLDTDYGTFWRRFVVE